MPLEGCCARGRVSFTVGGVAGRPVSVAGGRRDVVSVRLSAQEKAALDRLRGSMSASDYIRLLVKAANKRNGV